MTTYIEYKRAIENACADYLRDMWAIDSSTGDQTFKRNAYRAIETARDDAIAAAKEAIDKTPICERGPRPYDDGDAMAGMG